MQVPSLDWEDPLEQEMAISLSFICIYFILVALGLPAASRPFSSCGELGLLSSCGIRASHCGGFSCHRAPALDTWVSVVAASGLNS